MYNRVEEIRQHLRHRDHSLALRRMLDLSLDSGRAQLLTDAVSWSRRYRASRKAAPEGMSAEFEVEAERLLAAIEKHLPATEPAPAGLLEANGITKRYVKGHFVLRPISLNVRTHDVIGVVGENGNGKTTLLRCLAGQLATDKGTLSFPLLQDPDRYTIRGHVAFIPQRIPKWYGLLKDNLHFSAAIAGIQGEENSRMVEFMLERLNLAEYAHLTWNQISSGYRTRFEIARVLLQKPSLLILDEPLANLDINAQQTILTDLRYLAKSAWHPMGIVLSSQQLHEVEKIADTVLLIQRGECLFRTGKQSNGEKPSFAMELETAVDRDTLRSALADERIQVQFNGGFYTLVSEEVPVQELLRRLLEASIPMAYFRDITHSTKRYF